MSDIKFSTSDEVIVEAFILKCTGADFKMDYAPRRSNNTEHRRAIVHDFNDGITVNWAEDYPGGITLNGDVKVNTVSGTHLYVKHHDLHLDNESRRSSSAGDRRALVHDFNDGLTINWNNDYPGGVTIKGDVKVDKLKGSHLYVKHHDLHLDNESRRSSAAGDRRAMVHDFNDGLTINWNNDYPGGVTIKGEVKCTGSLKVAGQNIMTLITALQNKVQELEDRIAALESGT